MMDRTYLDDVEQRAQHLWWWYERKPEFSRVLWLVHRRQDDAALALMRRMAQDVIDEEIME